MKDVLLINKSNGIFAVPCMMSVYPNSRLRPGSGEYLRAHLQSGMAMERTCASDQIVGLSKDTPEKTPDKGEDSEVLRASRR